MSDFNRTCGQPVYGRASSTSGLTLGGGVARDKQITLANPASHTTGTDVPFTGGLMAGFGRIAVEAPGTSVWRPPDC